MSINERRNVDSTEPAILGNEENARTIVATLTEPDGRDPTKAAEAKHVRAAATRKARVWIRVIQAQIHDRMGEESAGTRRLSEVIESAVSEFPP